MTDPKERFESQHVVVDLSMNQIVVHDVIVWSLDFYHPNGYSMFRNDPKVCSPLGDFTKEHQAKESVFFVV